MGMHDRDWYREDYAQKNGMVYNKRTATYSSARRFAKGIKRQAIERPFLFKLALYVLALVAIVVAKRTIF